MAVTLAALLGLATALPQAVEAQRHGRHGFHDDRGSPGYYRRGDGYYRRDGGRRLRRDRDRPRRCRDRGTGGTIIGAIAGGLLGNSLAGHGDRTMGAILGGGAGALAGRAIDRDC